MSDTARMAGFPAGAMIRRELISETRRPRMFVVVGLAVLTGIAAVLLNWPESTADMREASRFANNLFGVIATLLMATVICTLPAVSAGSIVSERERETDELLRMSLISSTGFVFAKALNALGSLVVLMAGFVPIVSVVFFLSGVGTQQVLAMFVLLSVMSVMIVSVSLFCSACTRRTLPAVALSYIGMLVVMFLPVVVAFLGVALAGAFGAPVRSLIGALEPVFVSLMPITSFLRLVGGDYQTTPILGPIAVQAGWAVLFLGLCVWRVHRPFPPAKIEATKSIEDAEELKARRQSFPFYLIDPLKRRPMIEDERNPMLIREIRWGAMTRGSATVRVFYSSFVVYLVGSAIIVVLSENTNDVRQWILVQMAITLLIAPAMLANAFTRERELGNIDMLRMTLLRPNEIVAGKFFTGMAAVMPLLSAAVVSCAFLILLGVREFAVLGMGYASLAAAAVLALAVAIAASLVAQRTATAIGLAYIATLFLIVGSVIVARYVFIWMPTDLSSPQGSAEQDQLSAMASFVSPVFGYMHAAAWDWRTRAYEPNYPYWIANVLTTLVAAYAIARSTVWYYSKFRTQDV